MMTYIKSVGGALAAIFCAAAPALAGNPVKLDGTYVGLRLAGGWGDLGDVAFTGTTPPNSIHKDSDIVGGLGLAVGKYWHPNGLPLRTEVSYQYKLRLDADFRSGTAPVVGFENNIATHLGMLSVYYDLRTGTGITPYAGVGLGFARHETESERTVIQSGATTESSTSNINTAWAVSVGAVVDINARWGLDLGYRYIDMGKVDSGPNGSGESIEADRYTSHDFLITLHYRF